MKPAKSNPTLVYLSPDQLDFDPSNPRFSDALTAKDGKSIQARLMQEPYYSSELIDSLVTNGYIDYEPMVVKRKGERYVVVEGNRRLAAIKEIRANIEKYKKRVSDLESIPVLVFPEAADEQQRNEMRVYLGVRHLMGFRDWPPLSKAKYLDRESKAAKGGLDQVLDETRQSKSQARRFLIPYRLLLAAKISIPDGEDFWVLGEALQRAGIKKFIQLEVDSSNLEVTAYDKKNLVLLLDDLYGPKKASGDRNPEAKVVHDTRDLSRLSKVLGSDKACAELRKGKSLDEAEIYVDTRAESLRRLTKFTKELGVLVKKLATERAPEDIALATAYKSFDMAARFYVKKYKE